jgi:hypothetical protein
VPLAQPERGLIPLLLDGQAAEPWVSGERVFPTLTGPQPGPLTINGFACLSAATVNGGVTVRPGGTLIATGSTIGGRSRPTAPPGSSSATLRCVARSRSAAPPARSR